MGEEVWETVLSVLDECKLTQSAKVLRYELKHSQGIVLPGDRERNLLRSLDILNLRPGSKFLGG
jgi:hypothetical protein